MCSLYADNGVGAIFNEAIVEVRRTFLHLSSDDIGRVSLALMMRPRSLSDSEVVSGYCFSSTKVGQVEDVESLNKSSDIASTCSFVGTSDSDDVSCNGSHSSSAWSSEDTIIGGRQWPRNDRKMLGYATSAALEPCEFASATATAPLRCSHPWEEKRTTLVLKNLPNKFNRSVLVELLDVMGFRGLYDFVYIPIDFKTRASYGYGFVNMMDPHSAVQLHQVFNGFHDWGCDSLKVCMVEWSNRQGLSNLLGYYANSRVTHCSVPDEFKPALFSRNGERLPFPEHTEDVRAPRRLMKAARRALRK